MTAHATDIEKIPSLSTSTLRALERELAWQLESPAERIPLWLRTRWGYDAALTGTVLDLGTIRNELLARELRQ